MSITINVAGLATIKIGSGGAAVAQPGEDGYVSGGDADVSLVEGGLETLGYTRGGAHITLEAQMDDFKSDAYGESGAPAEIIYLSETARIKLELTKWSRAVQGRIARVRRLVKAAAVHAGTPQTPGSLLFANYAFFRVLINTPNDPMNFPCCVPREPIEINKGTKFSTLVMTFDAYRHPTTGVLYNGTYS